jgi:hypothetical protein
MRTRFFCDEARSKRARVENEIISDIGIFVSKKIYLLHLVHKDGYDVDEMKVMGHAIKKTIITKVVKSYITSMLEKYFKNHDWAEFNRDIATFKKQLECTKNIFDIGVPGKVNKVEPYTEAFEKDPNTRLPGGQSAAIFWNICLNQYNDLESPKITSQMAVRKYYLEVEYGRFNSIAVPSDIIKLPDWFTEHFIPIIDVDKQIDRLVDKTLTNICEAVGKPVPSDKAVLANETLVY